MRIWHLVLVLFVAMLVADYFDYRHASAERLKMVRVGYVMGQCDVLANVAKANPDSVWTHSPTTVAALKACEQTKAVKRPFDGL